MTKNTNLNTRDTVNNEFYNRLVTFIQARISKRSSKSEIYSTVWHIVRAVTLSVTGKNARRGISYINSLESSRTTSR